MSNEVNNVSFVPLYPCFHIYGYIISFNCYIMFFGLRAIAQAPRETSTAFSYWFIHLYFSCMYLFVLSHSVISYSLWPHGPYSLPGSSIHGIFQARILMWVTTSYSRGSCPPRGRSCISCIAGGFFYCWPIGKPV